MKFRSTRLLVLFSVILLTPALTLARAGGGEGYNGGGHGGGGGGGGGGEGGGFIIQLIFFCLQYPAIGIPVLIVIAIAFFYFQRTGGMSGPPMDVGIPPRSMAMPVGDAIGEIRLNDPAFSPDAFCNRVGAGFMKLQAAWCDQNLQAVRPFISDGIHERFLLQFAEQKAEGYRDRMEQVGIDNIRIANSRSDEIYDELSVEISAHAADFKVSFRDGSPLHGRSSIEPFAEVWSFLRRRGIATVIGKPGLLEGNCPNCGAAIEINESANCKNCNALLRSGQYDWVLSEITQASEWRVGGGGGVPGLEALRERDADLNVQSLEDRASVVFWRKAAADRIGRLDPMFKVSSPAYGQAYATRLKVLAGQPRGYFGRCAVGSVEAIGFVVGTTEAPVDRALIGIRWSGVKMLAQPDGQLQAAGENLPHHTLFVLMRKSTAKTEVAKGISSAHCPNCGAPESGGTTGGCEFCGTALNDGSNGWVLDNILSFSDAEAQRIIRSLQL